MSDTATATRTKADQDPSVRQPRLWNVVLLNDEEHTYEYVIRMVQAIFHHPLEKAFMIAQTVDTQDRAVLFTTHKEHAELKREQVHGYGPDRLIASCKGSMSALIEPAESGPDDEGKPRN